MTDTPASPPTELSYVNGCYQKSAYTKREAKAALRKTLTLSGARRIPGKGPLAVYHCAHCGRWHLGHSKIRVGR